MTHSWSRDAVFYHIYPLGFCGVPFQNDFSSTPTPRLEKISTWLDHICGMGFTALYLGPLFESSTHGYDTADYFHVDRRLGTDETFTRLSTELHSRGIRLVLDGVFNHVGRDFWAFRDVRQHGESSAYCNWFSGLHFGASNRWGDPFRYDSWNGHDELVKLNLSHPDVRNHLFAAVTNWIEAYGIDGLRLDAADQVDLGFLRDLSNYCRSLKSDFWLMGEVVAGDYRRWVSSGGIDSTTNYEAYKGLYSSHNDRNYFEIAYTFNREFGESGIYRDIPLYNFADNHDVNRIASQLKNRGHLNTLFTLLFTMPGIPSIYYGSEFGLQGIKNGNDTALRPALELDQLVAHPPFPELPAILNRLIHLRHSQPALRYGSYRQVHLASQQFAFLREWQGEHVLVAVNAVEQPVQLEINSLPAGQWIDLLDGDQDTPGNEGQVRLLLPDFGAKVLRL